MASTSNGVRKGVSSLRESDGIAERRSLDDEEAQWYAAISNPRNAPPSIFREIYNHLISSDLRFPHSLSEFRTTSCKGSHIFGISVILWEGKGSHAKTRRRERLGIEFRSYPRRFVAMRVSWSAPA
jgi:hypothetical protein